MSDPTPGYTHAIPAPIMTPDRVSTRIGDLDFFDGMPSAETVRRTLDHLDFLRGVEAFLNGIPASSLEAMRRGLVGVGATSANRPVIFDDLMDSSPLFLTGNTDTVYCIAVLDLDRDGPTVVEIPQGCGPGTLNDAWFRFVVDMGSPGPDRGAGGKYLILPHDYDGEVPDGYFTATSPSSYNWLALRGFLVDGSPAAASAMFRNGLKIYPLAQADAPPPMEFISASGQEFNTIHANDADFYEELHAVIDREPIGVIDPETRGLLASIGIRKGQAFAPDERMRAILEDSAAVANATARALWFRPRDPAAYIYDDGSAWKTGFIGNDYRWLIDDGEGGRNLDARTYFHYVATVNTPAMALKMVGRGSQYALANVDGAGNYLDGSRSYTLRLPPNPPAKDFWSVVVYDPQTRSELQTGQPYPSKNGAKDPVVVNADGTIDLHFGPSAPDGCEPNWIQTVPGKGWFVILRLYGPLEPWFDQSWRPGEIELVG